MGDNVSSKGQPYYSGDYVSFKGQPYYSGDLVYCHIEARETKQ